MTVKARVATGTFDLTIEAETNAEAADLLKLLDGYLKSAGDRAPKLRAGPPEVIMHPAPIEPGLPPPPFLAELPSVIQSDSKTGLLTLRAKLHEAPGQTSRAADAALVVLLGYTLQGKDSTYGTTLMKSLRQTGYNIERVDRPLEPYQDKGLVLVSGTKKSRAYHLTEHGKDKARELIEELTAAFGASP